MQCKQDQAPKTTKFKIGDVVTYVNDYGVKFPGKTITGFEYWGDPAKVRYFYAPHDAPWFSVPEASLTLEFSPSSNA